MNSLANLTDGELKELSVWYDGLQKKRKGYCNKRHGF